MAADLRLERTVSMKWMLLLTVWMGFAGCGLTAENAQGPAEYPIAWEWVEGAASPECAYWDPTSQCVYVSLIGEGGATGKDGDGAIARLSLQGKVRDARWVTGLNAPKGLRRHGDRLWVSDIDQLVGIDIETGKIAERIPVEGATFLNDVACDDQGGVYVSDTVGGKIYRYAKGQLEVFAEGDALESPNGLLVVGNQLIVAAWGLTPDLSFATETPGQLFALDLNSGGRTPISREPLGNLDGLETVAKGRYLVSDWNAGTILYVNSDGVARPILKLPKGAADIGYVPDAQLLIVPQMLENKVTAFRLRRPAARPERTPPR
jgi:sugar lactone lactonase YvrE